MTSENILLYAPIAFSPVQAIVIAHSTNKPHFNELTFADCWEFALFSGVSDSLLDLIRIVGLVFGPSIVLTNIPSLKSPAKLSVVSDLSRRLNMLSWPINERLGPGRISAGVGMYAGPWGGLMPILRSCWSRPSFSFFISSTSCNTIGLLFNKRLT